MNWRKIKMMTQSTLTKIYAFFMDVYGVDVSDVAYLYNDLGSTDAGQLVKGRYVGDDNIVYINPRMRDTQDYVPYGEEITFVHELNHSVQYNHDKAITYTGSITTINNIEWDKIQYRDRYNEIDSRLVGVMYVYYVYGVLEPYDLVYVLLHTNTARIGQAFKALLERGYRDFLKEIKTTINTDTYKGYIAQLAK